MRRFDILRVLTPLGWGLALAIVVAVALALSHGLGFRWDPFDLAGRRLAAAESDAAARRLEIEGTADQARRVDIHHQQAVSVARATDRAETRARNAHDASSPLDPARAARLREHDRRLCDLAPAVCGAAPGGPAGGDDHAVSAGPAARGGDTG